jgi:precorrin-2 dehydrogenase/sirohydrochlorin ferrochelatase
VRYLPINLDIAGRRVLVVGGGRVATRKVKSLRECGAEVTVVSPAFCSGLARMGGIRRLRRGYRKADLRGMWLVVSAAGPQAVNRRVWEHARQAGIPVNVVDQPDLCTFTVPAVLTRGELVLTVSTGGGSPALSGRIREILAAAIGPEFGKHLALLREMRAAAKASALPLEARSSLLKAMSGDAVRERLRRDGVAATRRHLRSLLEAACGRHAAGLPG